MQKLLLEVTDLTVKYSGGLSAVSGVSFVLPEYGGIALAGPCGSGKSSILKAIAGLSDYTGNIVVGGKDISEVHVKQRDFVFAAHNSPLPESATVKACLGYGLKLRKAADALIEQRIQEVSGLFGLTEELGKKIKKLDAVRRRYVIAARALMRDAKLYLFDDIVLDIPAADAENIKNIILGQIGSKASYIFSATDFDTVRRFSDVILLNRGRVVQGGSAVSIMAEPLTLFSDTYSNCPNVFTMEVDFSDGVSLDGLKYSPVFAGNENTGRQKTGIACNATGSQKVGNVCPPKDARRNADSDDCAMLMPAERNSTANSLDAERSGSMCAGQYNEDDNTTCDSTRQVYISFLPEDCSLADCGIESRVVSVWPVYGAEKNIVYALFLKPAVYSSSSAAMIFSESSAGEGDTVFLKIDKFNLYDLEGMRLLSAVISPNS